MKESRYTEILNRLKQMYGSRNTVCYSNGYLSNLNMLCFKDTEHGGYAFEVVGIDYKSSIEYKHLTAHKYFIGSHNFKSREVLISYE